MKMAMKRGEIGLDGFCSRGSFWGKCGVREEAGVRILRSYNVNYAAFYNGVIIRLYNGEDAESATSLSHYAAFCAYCGVPLNGKTKKAAWHSAPYIAAENCNDAEIVKVVKSKYAKVKAA